ncbi:MAG: flagellar basal body P-ring protein FlgI, partial [Planctomycetota bacterium]|nr:flagellar basal body P-ring protein FlgI [Planctomycetota bacterium]
APAAPFATRGPIRTPISSLVAVRGQEDNIVTGIGLVDGLAGTGDSGDLAKQLLQNMMLTQNIKVELSALNSKNIAVVRVEAEIAAGLKPGRRIPVRVSTIGDATSLEGGTLVMTELTDIFGTTSYATAAGPVNVGGFSAGGDGASATKNHVTVGTIPGGGKIEREVPTQVVSDHGYVYLDARAGQDTFGNIVRISEAVNGLYPTAASALPDGKTVRVKIPDDLAEGDHVAYVDSILRQEVISDDVARVIVNTRTGVIIIGGGVRLRAGAIAHGNLTVTIAETPEASQPGPLSNGSTEVLPRTTLDVEEENNGLVLVPGAVTLNEVVEVLNVMGTTPRDLISILEAMAQGGLLVADIRRM